MTRNFQACSVLLAVAVTALPALSAGHKVVREPHLDARRHGGYLFTTSGCEQCHSIFGVGGDRAPDLGSVGLRRQPRQIRIQIMNGGGGMPPFGHILKKVEIDDLVEFLSSCRSKVAPGCRDWMPSPQ